MVSKEDFEMLWSLSPNLVKSVELETGFIFANKYEFIELSNHTSVILYQIEDMPVYTKSNKVAMVTLYSIRGVL